MTQALPLFLIAQNGQLQKTLAARGLNPYAPATFLGYTLNTRPSQLPDATAFTGTSTRTSFQLKALEGPLRTSVSLPNTGLFAPLQFYDDPQRVGQVWLQNLGIAVTFNPDGTVQAIQVDPLAANKQRLPIALSNRAEILRTILASGNPATISPNINALDTAILEASPSALPLNTLQPILAKLQQALPLPNITPTPLSGLSAEQAKGLAITVSGLGWQPSESFLRQTLPVLQQQASVLQSKVPQSAEYWSLGLSSVAEHTAVLAQPLDQQLRPEQAAYNLAARLVSHPGVWEHVAQTANRLAQQPNPFANSLPDGGKLQLDAGGFYLAGRQAMANSGGYVGGQFGSHAGSQQGRQNNPKKPMQFLA